MSEEIYYISEALEDIFYRSEHRLDYLKRRLNKQVNSIQDAESYIMTDFEKYNYAKNDTNGIIKYYFIVMPLYPNFVKSLFVEVHDVIFGGKLIELYRIAKSKEICINPLLHKKESSFLNYTIT